MFAAADIPVLVLKGAALAFLVYPQPGLRCMRDIDLLVKAGDAQRAQALLWKEGFDLQPGLGLPMPAGHHHLPVLARQIEGLTICVEIHDDLFPKTRYYQSRRFEDLSGLAVDLQIGDAQTRTLGYEDMLWHIYRHAIGPPLLASPLRFIHIADLVSLVECKIRADRLGQTDPLLPAGIPNFAAAAFSYPVVRAGVEYTSMQCLESTPTNRFGLPGLAPPSFTTAWKIG